MDTRCEEMTKALPNKLCSGNHRDREEEGDHGILGEENWSQKWEQQDSSRPTAGGRWRRRLKSELDGENWSFRRLGFLYATLDQLMLSTVHCCRCVQPGRSPAVEPDRTSYGTRQQPIASRPAGSYRRQRTSRGAYLHRRRRGRLGSDPRTASSHPGVRRQRASAAHLNTAVTGRRRRQPHPAAGYVQRTPHSRQHGRSFTAATHRFHRR